MKNLIFNIIGWYGVAAILTAYFLVSFQVILSDSVLFQLLNLSGAIGVTLVSWIKRSYQPAALNLIWAIIALVALIQIFAR